MLTQISIMNTLNFYNLPDLECIADLPQACAKFMETLLCQPPNLCATTTGKKKLKTLYINNWNDLRLCYVINECANYIFFTSQKNWDLHPFIAAGKPLSISTFFTDSITGLGNGLSLVDDEIQAPRHTPGQLKNIYEKVLEYLRIGWKAVDISEGFSSLFSNVEEFQVFVKTEILHEEEVFIRHIALKFKMEDDIICKTLIGEGNDNLTMLGVKYSIRDKFDKIFNFDLSSKPCGRHYSGISSWQRAQNLDLDHCYR